MSDNTTKSSSVSGAGRFATTHWSVVLQAGQPGAPGYQQALETLCRGYWFPLYAYLRRHGYDSHQAEDYTQAFFCKVLEKQVLRSADSKRGRFRSFLLATLKNFLADERDRARAQKRGGGRKLLSIDFNEAENQYALEPADRLDEVVLRTLEKEPERRYQHASEVKTDVEKIRYDRKAETNASWSPKAGDDIESIRHRVWIPAVGLLVAGMINCLGVVGVLWSVFRFMPGATKLPIVILMAAHAVVVILGAWNLMQLRSYRLAVAGGILGILPFTPGAIIGLPMGIWALVVMTKKEVKAAFGQKKTEVVIPPKIREFTVSAVKDAKVAYGRGKAKVQKIIRETSTPPLDYL